MFGFSELVKEILCKIPDLLCIPAGPGSGCGAGGIPSGFITAARPAQERLLAAPDGGQLFD